MKLAPCFLALAAAAAFAGIARAGDRVLVVPFNMLNVPAAQQWIGNAVQENLVADLGRSGQFAPLAFRGQVIVEDNATAARLARQAHAPLAIRGAAQVIGDNARLTAQLIDAKSGDTLRTALVTGSAGNLLHMEDELAGQLRGTPAPAAVPTAGIPVAPAYAPAAQPPVIVIAQPQPAYYPNYPYDYNYPYPYNYPLGYYPFMFYQVTPGSRAHGRGRGSGGDRDSGGGAGGLPVVRNGGGGFNPNGLPIPNNNVLPIPDNNVLPIPTNNVLPVPTNNVLPLAARQVPPLPANNLAPLPTKGVTPLPTISPPTPRASAGQNRNPRLVN